MVAERWRLERLPNPGRRRSCRAVGTLPLAPAGRLGEGRAIRCVKEARHVDGIMRVEPRNDRR